ncbi:hypothetical protein GMSM_45640 [Geomonas sp. Red276]
MIEAFKKVEVKTDAASSALQLIGATPVLVIPSGGLYGYENSSFFKATLNEFVKQGGTLIVFAQQHGYDFSVVPTPDGKTIAAYGWTEDQSCLWNGTYVDTYHQILASVSDPTVSAGVDGYFASYPANSTILLRRSVNSQPAMLMYPYGQGQVIVSSLYTDWGYAHSQATTNELAIVRDMLTWAKKPAMLPEIKPGNQITVPVTVTNSAAGDAATVRLQLYNPDRSVLLSSQDVALAVPAGGSATITQSFVMAADSALGIYHVDYLLLDAGGNIVQPQAETDSGRFVVSNPPTNLQKSLDFNFAVNSDSEQYPRGASASFTVTMYNNTDSERTITAKYFFPHHSWETGEDQYGGDWYRRNVNLIQTLTISPRSSANFTHILNNARASYDRLWAYFYDENGQQVGDSSRGFYVFTPAITVTATPDKADYTAGDNVNLALTLQNKQNASSTVNVQLRVADPMNVAVFTNSLSVSLSANGTSSQNLGFALPPRTQAGAYTISAEAFDSFGNKIGGNSAAFEVPMSRIAVSPDLSAALIPGATNIALNLTNSGKFAVSAGTLSASLTDPDGAGIASNSWSFALAAGQMTSLALPVSLPPLKFGTYSLSFTQSDETRAGKPVTVSVPNAITTTVTFDRTSYWIRGTANPTIALTNTGKFTIDGLSVSVSAPDAGFSDTRTMSLAAGQSLSFQEAVTLPTTMGPGQHNLTVTLTLPSGSSLSKSFVYTLPQSSLALSLNQTGYTAGDVLAPSLINRGGVDTQAQYRISLYDAKSALIADKTMTETVAANGSLNLALPLPAGTTDGNYSLTVSYSDTKTGKSDLVQKSLVVTGVKASLVSQTAKGSYLSTETISATSSVTNSGTSLQNGNLHLQVSTATGIQKQKTWTSQADFQQAVRNQVDTYGTNDSMIGNDDFEAGLDPTRWNTWGTVVPQNGKMYVDSTTNDSGFGSTSWSLAGDFDVQVDFDNNIGCSSEGAELDAYGGPFWFYMKNTPANMQESGALINGGWYAWRWNGNYQQSGKLRITRTGSTLTGYGWTGTSWTPILSSTNSAYTANAGFELNVWRGKNCAAHSNFDNFIINSGRVVTVNETTDAVRLLRTNDNFDDGVLNTDRWSVRSSGSAINNESNGTAVTKDPAAGTVSYSNLAGRFPLNGDFDISVDWATVAPSSAEWDSVLMVGDTDQNTASDNNVVGNALQIKRAYVNGVGHIYQTGHYNGSSWDSLSSPVPTGDTAGRFRIKRVASAITVWYWNNSLNRWEWNGSTSGYSWNGVWTTASYVEMGVSNSAPNMPAAETDWNNFKSASGYNYAGQGTLRLVQDAGQTSNWQTLAWTSTEPIGTSVKFRTRTAATQADLANSTWSDYLTSGSPITSPKARWIELEATLATTNSSVTPLLQDVTVTYASSQGDVLWQTDVPLNLAPGGVSNLMSTIGTLANAGKYYLQGTVTSGTGQTVASYEYPFQVAQGNTSLSILPDKRVYKPGETATISGEVRNISAVTASNLVFSLQGGVAGGPQQTIYSETFSIPAGGSHPYTATMAAGATGTVALSGTVAQGTTTLAKTTDQFEVSSPLVTATVTAPAVTGSDPFTITLQLRNDGKTDATVLSTPSITAKTETLTVPAGQQLVQQYAQQIAADSSYNFTFTGDLNQTITKSVRYGVAGSITLASQSIYAEGAVGIAATVNNSGLIDSNSTVSYQLLQGGTLVGQQSRGYFTPQGTSSTDTINYSLTEGSYQLTASSSLPAATSSTSFEVRKATKVSFSMAIGGQTGSLLPVTVSLNNLGFNPIVGVARVSLVDGNGTVVWSSAQEVSLPFAQVSVATPLSFAINLAALQPAPFIIKAEILDTANQQLAVQTAPFTLQPAIFDITQLPQYQTVAAGGSATMTFKVKNSGTQEGPFDLSFKADDLIDSTRTAWLKPGEEKEISFTFTTAADLEEKDYSASYRLSSGGATIKQGAILYHLSGITLSVTAKLDRDTYNTGDTANLTVIIDQVGGGAVSLLARANYNGYQDQRNFTLNGTQALTFSVPLTQITGEKLFYGIYYPSGRSIHLNSVYIYKANGVLTVTTDKQVYNPGDTVTVSMSGTATGTMTLTGPTDPMDPFAFNGSQTVNFPLPAAMTAGTYTVSYSLTDPAGSTISGSTPFDVAGIQVKVKEALLDRATYAASDTMGLSLNIESNLDLPATIKTWVVDPDNNYTDAGSGDVTLTAAAPVLANQQAALATASMGIHKLVYGIYQGDLLLASGAKAFDIGQAALLGLSTDKTDYPSITVPVSAKVDLYGNTQAGIECFLDGASVKTDTVTFTGFTSYSFTIQPEMLTPGMHSLKVTLTAGGLTSSKTVTFSFGSNLPDLVVRLGSGAVKGSSLMLTATVSNIGKSASGATTVTLYDSDPALGVAPFATLAVPAVEAGASVDIGYAWNVLGKAGDYTLWAKVDPGNTISEYSKANNTIVTAGTVPKLGLSVSAGGTSFKANTDVAIAASYANLSSSLYQDLLLQVTVADSLGGTTVFKESAIATLNSSSQATDTTAWNTAVSQPGTYTVTATLLGGGSVLLTSSASFNVEPTFAVTGAATLNASEVSQGAPINVTFAVSNSGNIDTAGSVRVQVVDAQSGAVKSSAEQPVNLPVKGSQSGQLSFPTDGLELKNYQVTLQYLAQDRQVELAGGSFVVKDGTPPVVTVQSPVAGQFLNSSVRIAALATDDASGVDRVEYQVDAGGWNPLTAEDVAKGSYAVVWQPSSSDSGTHTVRVRGVDRAGNISIPIPVAFTVDLTPPVLTVSTLGDGSYTNNDTLNIAGNAFDLLGLKGVTINGNAVSVSPDGGFSFALTLLKGENAISTVASDLAGNSVTDTRTITLDQDAPVLSITTPADNSKTASRVIDVNGSVEESASVQIMANGVAQTASMAGLQFTATAGLNPGLNTITITATDLAGNASSQKRTVIFDDQAPSLSVTEPGQDVRTNQSAIKIRGNASDPLTAVGVTVTMDGQTYTPALVNGWFEQVVNMSVETSHAITVTATNEVGTQTTVVRNVIYDITPPALSIAPVVTPTTQSNQSISGTREEGTMVTVSSATATTGAVTYPTSTTWESTVSGLALGDNTITAAATDVAGNVTSASVVVTLVNTAPDVSISATPKLLWPPDHKMVPVKLVGEAVPHGCDLQSVTISVTDEYGKYAYNNLKFGDTVMLEAWRNGTDANGRVYTITAVVKDKAGTVTTRATTVTVPHDQSK